MSSVDPQALRDLLDREAIRECLYRYCRGIDRLDEAGLPGLDTTLSQEGARDPLGEENGLPAARGVRGDARGAAPEHVIEPMREPIRWPTSPQPTSSRVARRKRRGRAR